MRPLCLLALALGGCTLIDLPLEGLGCDDLSHHCPTGLRCDPVAKVCRAQLDADGGGDAGGPDGGGQSDAGSGDAGTVDAGQDAGALDAGPVDAGPELACHLFDAVPAVRCTSRTDYYLSPTGGAPQDGLSPATAWTALTGHTLAAGARIHLEPGDYFTDAGLLSGLSLDGTTLCPIEVLGPVDGGQAIVHVPTLLGVSYVWLHDFEIDAVGNAPAIKLPFLDGIRLERLRFHGTLGGSARDVDAVGCQGLVITGCEFSSPVSQVITISFGDLQFLGNRVTSVSGGQLQVPPNTLVEGNDVTGSFFAPAVIAISSPGDAGLVVRRNVFRDIADRFNNPLTVAPAAIEVTGNTFFNITNGTATDAGVFRDNVVVGLVRGTTLSASAAQAGYNLFDTVTMPYASGTGAGDVMAPFPFEAGFVPAAGSAAIDAADPARPVPPGGGARADIGAIERDAGFDSNRRYCMDGGY
jgi:hypothetical protein